jgi:dsDNA-specific endonuclease/ATPase MutS2
MSDHESPFPEPFEIEITDTLDLHAFRPNEIRGVVTAYLDEALNMGYTVVRIIHGKGIGVQREIVRKLLAESELVDSFKNAPEFSGGEGSTIVKLNLK